MPTLASTKPLSVIDTVLISSVWSRSPLVFHPVKWQSSIVYDQTGPEAHASHQWSVTLLMRTVQFDWENRVMLADPTESVTSIE